ncbi:MAG: hypothetical protein P9L90_06465 [Candidatus Aadella gelida]|nr:hypothetical protein [Candidatus Aadella gelida]
MKPRKNFRSRPKKTGAKKNAKISAQMRRLIEMGYKEEKLVKMTSVEIRDLLKVGAKKIAKAARTEKTAKKAAAKPAVKKEK